MQSDASSPYQLHGFVTVEPSPSDAAPSEDVHAHEDVAPPVQAPLPLQVLQTVGQAVLLLAPPAAQHLLHHTHTLGDPRPKRQFSPCYYSLSDRRRRGLPRVVEEYPVADVEEWPVEPIELVLPLQLALRGDGVVPDHHRVGDPRVHLPRQVPHLRHFPDNCIIYQLHVS